MPGIPNDSEAEQVWQATRAFAADQLNWAIGERRIFQVNYQHNGHPFVAEVGMADPATGETVMVILQSTAFLVCTANRGVQP